MNAVVAGTQAATIQGQLNFSRDVEREADRVGFQVMTAAGFAPGGMAAMFEKMDISIAPQRLRRLSVPAHPPADGRAHRRGARARRHRRRAGARQRPRAHGGPGARAGAHGHARRCAAPLAGARRRPRRHAPPTSCARRPKARSRSTLLRDWARADAAFAAALGIVRASPNSSARAERAVVLMQAQSLLDRARRPRPPRRCSPTPATARGRACCWRADRPDRDAGVSAGQRRAEGERLGAADLGRAASRRFARLVRARPDLGPARRAAALDARRGRGALRARRPARRRRSAARRPAPRAQRRPGRLHRRLGPRLAPARRSRRSAGRSSPTSRRADALTRASARARRTDARDPRVAPSAGAARDSFAQSARALRGARTGGS